MSCEETISVIDPTAVNENDQRVSVFPNPASDVVTIQCEGMQQVTLFNSIGQMIFTTEVTGNQAQIDLNTYPAGYYILQAQTASGVMTRKMVVE